MRFAADFQASLTSAASATVHSNLIVQEGGAHTVLGRAHTGKGGALTGSLARESHRFEFRSQDETSACVVNEYLLSGLLSHTARHTHLNSYQAMEY